MRLPSLQLRTVIVATLSISGSSAAPANNGSTLAASTPTTFPSDIQEAIQSFEGQVNQVIRNYAQNASEQETITDYSSTGRAFDFYLRNYFLPGGPSTCPQADEPLPAQAETTDAAIGYLQQTQLALINVSQDAINGDFAQGIVDFCEVIRLYGGAARNY
jgi:hypothetical protein